MVGINEWLPNPNGVDTKAEFIELFNDGNAPVGLDGWTVKATAKKVFALKGYTIAARGYLVLPRTETKLSLKNGGETVSLYDARGRLVDQSSYLGAAPSGESFSRVLYPGASGTRSAINSANENLAAPQGFAWGIPTPGAVNKVNVHNEISENRYPFGVALNGGLPGGLFGGSAFSLILLGVSAILAALVVYSLKSDENFSKLFFLRDGSIW